MSTQPDLDRATDRETARLTEELERSREARRSEQRLAEAWMSKCLKAEEQQTKLLNMISELADVASWYISFYNDVMSTAPVYFDRCADLNAVQYLHGEAQETYERARALLSEYASRQAAKRGRQPC